MNTTNQQVLDQFDDKVIEYLPNRPPMLLVNHLIEVSQTHAISQINLTEQSPFMTPQGVPAVIGIEYMGQTAALIAGYQLEQGTTQPHLGFLLGTRAYACEQAYFSNGTELIVECHEKAIVGDSLATFDCMIKPVGKNQIIATANLSVFRKPIEQ